MKPGWPWQVTAALWLFLADVLVLLPGATKLISFMTADNVRDPPSPGDGYLTAVNALFQAAFDVILVLLFLASLVLIFIVWTLRGWTRHLMVLFSTVFMILLLIIGGMFDGFTLYAVCLGMITLCASGLMYTDAAEIWFRRPELVVERPVSATVDGGFEIAAPMPTAPRGERPAAVSFAVGCLGGLLVLMFIDWSSNFGPGTDSGEVYFSYFFNFLVIFTLAFIPYGIWHGVRFARKIATPFCLISGLCLLPYIWGPNLLCCAMMILALACILFLSRRSVTGWFNPA